MTPPIRGNALIVSSPPGGDKVREAIYSTRLFNLQEYLASRGWKPSIDRSKEMRYDLVILIARAGQSASTLWAHSELHGGLAADFDKPSVLDWSDIDRFDPATPDATLDELFSAHWPPPEWVQFESTLVVGPAPGRDHERSKKVGRTASRRKVDERHDGPSHGVKNQTARQTRNVGSDRARLGSDYVVSATGRIAATLVGSALRLERPPGTFLEESEDWASRLTPPANGGWNLLAVGDDMTVSVLLSTEAGVVQVSRSAYGGWSLSSQVSHAPAIAGTYIDVGHALVSETGEVIFTGVIEGPKVRLDTVAGVDSARHGPAEIFIAWGRDSHGASMGEVTYRKTGQESWTPVMSVPGVVAARIRRASDQDPSEAPVSAVDWLDIDGASHETLLGRL